MNDESKYAQIIAVAAADPTDVDRDGNKLVTKNGNPFTLLRIRLRKGSKEEETVFADVKVFDTKHYPAIRAAVKSEVRKGTSIAVEGLRSERTVNGKTYVNILANYIYLTQDLGSVESDEDF